jgi:arginyl-tRNA synthetase
LKRYGIEEAFNADPFAHLFEVSAEITTDFQHGDDEYKAAEKRGEPRSIWGSKCIF